MTANGENIHPGIKSPSRFRASNKSDIHTIDRLYQRQRHIKSLSNLIGYAIEKNAEEGDGPTVPHIAACLDLIMQLADESRAALDELRA